MVERFWFFLFRTGILDLVLSKLLIQCVLNEFDAPFIAKLGEMLSHEISEIGDLPELVNDLQGCGS